MNSLVDFVEDQQAALGAVKASHEQLLLVIGLYSLLALQYDHEGHMEEHVASFTLDQLHEVEQKLNLIAYPPAAEHVPF